MTEAADQPITSLLDEALDAVERGDTSSAVEFATEVLRRDPGNGVARQLIENAGVAPGEMRRLAMMFVDLVGSTSLSTRIDTGSYRRIVRRYHREVDLAVTDHGGRVARKTGDGVLAFFGHPTSHEDDTARAVRAGLAIIRRIAAVRPDVEREFGETIDVRVAVHLGPVLLDLIDSEIYGLAPNLAARLQDLAAPNTVAVSDPVVELVGDLFEIVDHGERNVKGVDEPIRHFTVVSELPGNPRTSSPAPTPYLGRVAELDAVIAVAGSEPGAFEPSDEPRAVVVRGEPGMGKTRLVLEALTRTADPGRRVLWMICTEYEQSNEFGAAASLLRLDPSVDSIQGPAERLSQLARRLRSLGLDPDVTVPLLAPLLAIGPEVGYAPAEADLTVLRGQILDALRDWVEALASRSTVIIAVDDVQWADAATVELLSGFVNAPIDGVRLLATERASSDRLWGSNLSVVDLEPFSTMEATRLAHTVAGDLEDHHLETVLDRAEGNPLFLLELARMVEEPPPEIGPEAMSRLAEWSIVPRALYEPLLARLYRGDADIGLAQAAATVGRNFDLDVLEAVSDRPREAVERGIRSLVDAGLVEPDDPHRMFWFRHALIRDVAYDLMPDEQREEVHGRVADALTAQRSDGREIAWSTIATHLRSARRPADAVTAYESAADEARVRGALAQGYDHLTVAIDLLGSLSDSESIRLRTAEVRLRRAFLSVSQGGNTDPRAAADYEACLELTSGNDTGQEFVGTLVALFVYYAARGELDRADEMIGRIRATGITDDPDMMDESHATEGIVRWFRGDFVGADDCLSRSLEHISDQSAGGPTLGEWQIPQDTHCTTELQMALTRWQRGDSVGFGEHVRAASSRARDLPFPYGPVTTLFIVSYKALVLNEMGRFERSASEIRTGMALTETHHLAFWPISMDLAAAVAETGQELSSATPDVARLSELATRIGGAAMLYRMAGTLLVVPYILTNQGKALAGAGETAAALQVYDEALSLADELGAQWYTAETRRLRAHSVRSENGGNDDAWTADAVDMLRSAAALAREQGSVPFEIRALHDLRTAIDEGRDSILDGRADVFDPERFDDLTALPGALLTAGLDPAAVR